MAERPEEDEDAGDLSDSPKPIGLVEDVGVEVLCATAEDTVDEVAEVAAAAAELPDDVQFLVKHDAIVVATLHHIAVGAVEDHTDPGAHVLGRLEAARLEHDALVAVVVDGDLGVRHIAGIDVVGILPFDVIPQAAPVGDDGMGMALQVEPPARDIRLVGPLVAEVPIAVVPLPMPVVVQVRACHPGRRLEGRARPQVVVYGLGDRRGVVAQGADRAPALVAQPSGEVALADAALMDEGHGVTKGLM